VFSETQNIIRYTGIRSQRFRPEAHRPGLTDRELELYERLLDKVLGAEEDAAALEDVEVLEIEAGE